MEKPLILVAAGDPSGDLHGARLVRALRAGGARVAAVGGPLMRAEADEFLEDLASRALTGFWEPLAQAGFLLGLALRLRRFLRARRPAALVCIDYYGFNRRLLGLAKSAGGAGLLLHQPPGLGQPAEARPAAQRGRHPDARHLPVRTGNL